jgi:hypothetical protein
MFERGRPQAGSVRVAGIAKCAWLLVIAIALFRPVPGPKPGRSLVADEARPLDPAAWGGDHVGRRVPDYLTGDECLFCHRMDIGPGFAENRHNLTIRPIDEVPDAREALKQNPATRELADSVVYLLGGSRSQRYLKPSRAYGRLDLLSTRWQPPRAGQHGKLLAVERPTWDATVFADSCAGCHTTAVESATRAFSAVSLDCFVCHGSVDPKHSNDQTLVHLSRARRDPPRVVVSICAQCHARGGRSKSTGLPYANTFVAGDNLFRDFQVDLSPGAIARGHPADRHILRNVRDVVVRGDQTITCLSCHIVHRPSSARHQRLARREHCLDCHDATGRDTTFDAEPLHSQACQY